MTDDNKNSEINKNEAEEINSAESLKLAEISKMDINVPNSLRKPEGAGETKKIDMSKLSSANVIFKKNTPKQEIPRVDPGISGLQETIKGHHGKTNEPFKITEEKKDQTLLEKVKSFFLGKKTN